MLASGWRVRAAKERRYDFDPLGGRRQSFSWSWKAPWR
jgi:hypothetical protein